MSQNTEMMLLEQRDYLIRNVTGIFDDEFHRHFERFESWDWPNISSEGIRIWNLLFHEKISDDSMVGALLSAVAAQSSYGAVASMAAALGLNATMLNLMIAPWMENQGKCPPAMTWEKFMSEYTQIVNSGGM